MTRPTRIIQRSRRCWKVQQQFTFLGLFPHWVTISTHATFQDAQAASGLTKPHNGGA